MKKLLRVLKWVLFSFGVLLIAVVLYLHTLNFSMSQEEIRKAFDGLDYQVGEYFYTYDDREMHYVAIGDTNHTKVLFVHGSPGSWDNFLGFMKDPELLKDFRMISVDRPGFGMSGEGIPERSLEEQAELIAEILIRENTFTPTILVGHSYGGPVIARIVMDYPQLADGLIFVAASVDPKLEETKWYQVPVHYKVLSWVLPDMLYSTNEEILALKEELELIMPMWKEISLPVSVIQGNSDKLVPSANAAFMDSVLTNADTHLVIEEKMNHFIPWNRPELIRQELYSVMKRINSNTDQ